MRRLNQQANIGFTLAELLIALAILGVIATFTIPKVLNAQQDATEQAIAKEAAAAMTNALQAYSLNNTLTNSVGMPDLTPYLNYVAVDTASDIDRNYNAGQITCSNTFPCLTLHNGAKILYSTIDPFGGTAKTDALYFYVDPDGQVSSNPASNTGPGKSVVFFLYTDGRITTWGNLIPGTKNAGSNYSADSTKDPPWFSWD